MVLHDSDFIRSFTDSTFSQESSVLSDVEGYILLILFIGLFAVGVFIAIRYIITLQQRPRGKYKGEYKFQIADLNKAGANEFTAHISESDEQFTPKMVTDLLKITKAEKQLTEESVNEFKKLLEHCFIFNANISDPIKANILKGNKKAIIIANVDLGKEPYYMEEAEGHFTITTASFHKYTRNVQCISGQVKTIGNPKGQPVDVYLINVHGNKLKESYDDILHEEKYRLEVFTFPDDLDVEILGKLAMFLPTLVELYNKVIPSEDEINRLRDMIQKLIQEKGAILRELEIAKSRAVRKPVTGYERPFVADVKGVAWGWNIMAGIMGIIGYHLAVTQSILQNLPIISNPIVFGLLLVIIVILIRYTFENRKPIEARSNETNESEGVTKEL